jgi:hypothetical protein
MTYYIVDKRTGLIINAVEAANRAAAERVLEGFTLAEMLRIEPHPPLAALERYRYWNERPGGGEVGE